MLPLANGGIAHLSVLYTYQGAEVDPRKLALSNKLMEAVTSLQRPCWRRLGPVVLVRLWWLLELLMRLRHWRGSFLFNECYNGLLVSASTFLLHVLDLRMSSFC